MFQKLWDSNHFSRDNFSFETRCVVMDLASAVMNYLQFDERRRWNRRDAWRDMDMRHRLMCRVRDRSRCNCKRRKWSEAIPLGVDLRPLCTGHTGGRRKKAPWPWRTSRHLGGGGENLTEKDEKNMRFLSWGLFNSPRVNGDQFFLLFWWAEARCSKTQSPHRRSHPYNSQNPVPQPTH